MHYLPQSLRILSLGINVGIFYFIFAKLNHSWVPSPGGEFLWVIAGVGLWLVNLISAPWFSPPRDILASAITVAISLGTLVLPESGALAAEVGIFRWAVLIYSASILTICIATMALHEIARFEGISRMLMRMVDSIGRGDVLFSGLALVSIFGFYSEQQLYVALLIVVWFGFVLAKPVETILLFLKSLGQFRKDSKVGIGSGRIERVDDPNIIRVLLEDSSRWREENLFIANLSGSTAKYVLPLYSQVQGSQVIGTGLCCGDNFDGEVIPEEGFVTYAANQEIKDQLLHRLGGGLPEAKLVGFVVEGSTIGSIRFEVAAGALLEEGTVVFCNLNGEQIFFQILDAQTREENFQQNPRGTHIVSAGQIGSYDPEEGFKKHGWLPSMNQPVFHSRHLSEESSSLPDGSSKVGDVPFTDGRVLVDIGELIEFHSAILGVTGTGKTELVLDLIRSSVEQKAKVICVDFTGEYLHRLADLTPLDMGLEEEIYKKLNDDLFAVDSGKFGAGDEKKALQKTVDGLSNAIETQMSAFLEGDDQLAVLQLAEVFNSKATLRLTEIYLSSVVKWARSNRKREKVLIVLEEAHTIIPETAGAGFDFDTQWVVNRIGQIALQGRKYGVGLMLVSQRTALVSKTVLSQCNTFFVHALVDQTSLNFLSSVVNADYLKIIPNLRFLEFLAIGKSISSERPIVLRRQFDQAKKDASDAMNKVAEKET